MALRFAARNFQNCISKSIPKYAFQVRLSYGINYFSCLCAGHYIL